VIHIKHADGIPKYIQLANLLREKLAAREYSPGQQIPTETELCERYKVSRVTVREAIDRLVQENLLYREQGRGTYVTPQKLKRNVTKIYSFSYDMVRLTQAQLYPFRVSTRRGRTRARQ
jgi:GntR family transcriptional regulator